MAFEELSIQAVGCNPFAVFEQSWALLTAGNESSFNMMTISWGELGRLWDKPVCSVFVRPSRYTKKFIDAADDFSVSFFPSQYHQALEICGTKSGRDVNKVEASGLTPLQLGEIMTFSEANLVLTCHKLYMQDLAAEHFVDKTVIERAYPSRDFHTVYVGEVMKVHGQNAGHMHPHS